jgi:outer membrane protein
MKLLKLNPLRLSLAVAGVVVAGSVFASTVGVVDIQAVFDQTPQGHATLMKLQTAVQPQIDALKTEQQKLQSDAQAFQRNSPTLSAADRKTQEDALTAGQKAFQAKVAALSDSEHAQEKTAAQTFTDNLKTSVAQVAQKDGMDVVLTAEAAPYVGPKSDVTADVVKAMQGLVKS